MEDISVKTAKRTIMYPVIITVRVDPQTLKDIETISLFERMKVAVLCRRIIIEKIQVYQRNPAYKRFLKQLEQTEVKKSVE